MSNIRAPTKSSSDLVICPAVISKMASHTFLRTSEMTFSWKNSIVADKTIFAHMKYVLLDIERKSDQEKAKQSEYNKIWVV